MGQVERQQRRAERELQQRYLQQRAMARQAHKYRPNKVSEAVRGINALVRAGELVL